MKYIGMITAFILLHIILSFGQVPETDAEAKKEISKLSFIVGEWEGDGWMMGRDGKKHTFSQTEHIQFKLDTTAVLIEGIGRSDGQVVHNALAIIRYDKSDANYTFNSYLATGRSGSFNAELLEDRFYWYPNDNMRYIISLNDQGQWYETGEINRDGNWIQFFEMTLDKK